MILFFDCRYEEPKLLVALQLIVICDSTGPDVGGTWVELERLIEVNERAVQVAFIEPGETAVIPGHGKTRIEFDLPRSRVLIKGRPVQS